MKDENMKYEKKILGVCAWLAEKYDADPTLIRIIFLVLALFGFGSSIIIYIIVYFLMMPSEYR